MNYYFKTEKLSVGYDGKALIEDIDIGIEKGTILTLIGPNGAGKTTILKSIAKQLAPIAGTAYIDKKDLMEMSTKDISKTMALVLTKKLSAEMMTCRDVVATGRYPYTGRFGLLSEEDEVKVTEAMELVNVLSIEGQDFNKISDGQRQRVMLARALCQEPEIIILDEPTSFLDIKYKLEFMSVLQKLKKMKGLTVIMSLHELLLAKSMSDKVLCIANDKVDRFGSPDVIFTEEYISNLFGIDKELLLFAKEKDIEIVNN
ncbi:MAG TPA: ABC transporter ATP-binding protein [Lachnospiraceae bacterium]|nr:ABC transporter ATP-binding protein [Lachnospiraceae bacterium]